VCRDHDHRGNDHDRAYDRADDHDPAGNHDDWVYVELWRRDDNVTTGNHDDGASAGDDGPGDNDGRGCNDHHCHDDDGAVHAAGEARAEAGKAGEAGLRAAGTEAEAAGVHTVRRGTEERKQ